MWFEHSERNGGLGGGVSNSNNILKNTRTLKKQKQKSLTLLHLFQGHMGIRKVELCNVIFLVTSKIKLLQFNKLHFFVFDRYLERRVTYVINVITTWTFS